MATGSGLLGVALALVAAERPMSDNDEVTNYQVRILTLDGLDWRTSSYARLQPVARQGTSSVWTADKALAASLADRARACSPYHRITAVGEAELTKADSVHYIASMDRVADGPIDQSSAIAFMPHPEKLEERFSIRVGGRKLDQGILARIALEDTHVDVIHEVKQSEVLKAPATQAKGPRTPAQVGHDILQVVLTPEVADARQRIATSIQIPEVTRARVEGEWLIPNDGVLLVSLGVKTAADDQGKAVVRERVAVIEASAGPNFPAARTTTVLTAPSPTMPVSIDMARLVPATVPARSLPQPVAPDGTPVELPPLPEALASADLDRINPEPSQPSPQSPVLSTPTADAALARTGFDAAPPAPLRPDFAPKASAFFETVKLSEVIKELTESGVKLDIDVATTPSGAAQTACEHCDADTPFCPAEARELKAKPVAGGMKLAPSGKSQVSVTVKDGDLVILDGATNLDDVLKNPGKTETTLIPLSGPFSLELKVTVVPTRPSDPAKTAEKKGEAPANRRE